MTTIKETPFLWVIEQSERRVWKPFSVLWPQPDGHEDRRLQDTLIRYRASHPRKRFRVTRYVPTEARPTRDGAAKS